MQCIHIIRNPYTNTIRYEYRFSESDEWVSVDYKHNPNSPLVSERFARGEVSEEIINTIVSEYETDNQILFIVFSGLKEDFDDICEKCKGKNVQLAKSEDHVIKHDDIMAATINCLQILISSAAEESVKNQAALLLARVTTENDYNTVGEAYNYIISYTCSIDSSISELSDKIALLKEKIKISNDNSAISFRTKIREVTNQTIDRMQLNCIEEYKSELRNKVPLQTNSSIKNYYDSVEKNCNSVPQQNSSKNRFFLSVIKENKAEKSLRKSIEKEQEKKVQNDVINSLLMQQTESDKRIIPEYTDKINKYYQGRLPLIASMIQNCINEYGHTLVQQRMMNASNDVCKIPIGFAANPPIVSSLDIDRSVLIDRTKMAGIYNELLLKHYYQFITDYMNQVVRELKNNINEIVDIIADMDDETNPEIGSMIKQYNTARVIQIQKGIQLKQLAAHVKLLKELIEFA